MTDLTPAVPFFRHSRQFGASFGLALGALLLGSVVLVAQPLMAQEGAPAESSEAVAEPPAIAPDTAVVSGDAGAYLAARIAVTENNFTEGMRWFARALAADPANQMLMDGLILSQIGSGEFGPAAETAQVFVDSEGRSIGAAIALLVRDVKSKDFDKILSKSEERLIGNLVDDLTYAWAEFGKGRMSEAVDAFDKIAATDGLKAFGLYHKALALAAVGDFEGADAILSGEAHGPLVVNRRGVIAHTEILSQLERNDDALAMLNQMLASVSDPEFEGLRDRLQAGETLPFTVLTSAADGVAETLFTIAIALNGEATDSYTLLYTRAALELNPNHSEALLLAAGLLDQLGQLELAAEIFALLPKDHPGYYAAEIGRAEALFKLGRDEDAVEALKNLAEALPDLMVVQITYADALRRVERLDEAIAVYDRAIAMIKTPEPRHWPIFYSSGVTHERNGNWPAAEVQMRKALELNPNQPQVLNYLGYSLVDRGEKLEEAMSLIERAVAAQPDAGYIIDSLAWALYKVGRYSDALPHMERASVLEPVDPVVTDHLGDVYWQVGRALEARFQWRRALSFEPTEKDATRIRLKLEQGLDAVLAEEAKGIDG